MPRLHPCLTSLAFALSLLAATPAPAADYLVYFGTRDTGPDKGFSMAHFNSETGALSKPVFVQAAVGPGFFRIHPDGHHLYVANTRGLGVPGEGMVSAYAIDAKTGALTLINSQPSGGANPAYVSIDHTGHYVLAANYNEGTVAIFPILPDGSLGARTALDKHTGKSVTPDRAQQAYAHSIVTDPTNHFALSPDLGLDRVYIYKFDDKTGALSPNDPAFFTDRPGSGPRHVIFSPNGKFVYVVHEIANVVNAYSWDSTKGVLKELQSTTTLPAGFKDTNTAAEVEMHPNGKFLYVSNRGSNTIAMFAADPDSGLLMPLGHVPTQGKTPRNFTFDPTGQWLLASNMDSNSALVYRIDLKTGLLTQVGDPVTVPFPFCERFLLTPIAK